MNGHKDTNITSMPLSAGSGSGFAPGMYYYTLRVGSSVQGGRLLLVR